MYDEELLADKLTQISDALDRVARRFGGINSADDFLENEHGQDMLDAICMMLIAVGENFKAIDKITDGIFLERYPDVNWRGIKGCIPILSQRLKMLSYTLVFGGRCPPYSLQFAVLW